MRKFNLSKIKIYKSKEGKKGYSKKVAPSGFNEESYKSLGIRIGKNKWNREVEKVRGDDPKEKIKRVTYSKSTSNPEETVSKETKVKIIKKGRGVNRTVTKQKNKN
tara:strand:+ start:480 stop:797 length:318 start_codon:yes stop_codon:yes gene_type:complete